MDEIGVGILIALMLVYFFKRVVPLIKVGIETKAKAERMEMEFTLQQKMGYAAESDFFLN